MNFEIYKHKLDLNIDEINSNLSTVFGLEKFKMPKLIHLTREQITYMLDRFGQKKNLPKIAVVSSVASCIFQNVGGSDDMPSTDVMAISYIMFTSDNLRLHSYVQEINRAIDVENVFSYAEDTGVAVPRQFVMRIRESMPEYLWDILINRHEFKVDTQIDDKEADRIIDKMFEDVIDYLQSSKNTHELLDDLNIESEN